MTTIHEIYHAISNKIQLIYTNEGEIDYNSTKFDTGLERDSTISGRRIGTAFNEGMTQLMAERTVGYTNFMYPFETQVMSVLEHFGGRSNFISDYILRTSKVEENIQEKYGDDFLSDYKILRLYMDEKFERTYFRQKEEDEFEKIMNDGKERAILSQINEFIRNRKE